VGFGGLGSGGGVDAFLAQLSDAMVEHRCAADVQQLRQGALVAVES